MAGSESGKIGGLPATVPTSKSAILVKKSAYWQMSGKKTLFRGASYTRMSKSVLCLAGHLKSGMSYKAVYNIRSGNPDSGVLAGLWDLAISGLSGYLAGLSHGTFCLVCTVARYLLYGCTVARYLDCLDACRLYCCTLP